LSTKVHAATDALGNPVRFILTGGEASDYAAVDDLMALPLPKPKALLADKGYDGDRFRENLLMRGILPIIPPRSNRKLPVHPDYRRYRDRNRIERMFGKLKEQRRIATRYDKTVLSFESFLNLAAARLWLKSFVNAT
jgi:transposase